MTVIFNRIVDLNSYCKYQEFVPPLHTGFTVTRRNIIRNGRALDHSASQKRTRLMNIGFCNIHLALDGYLKFVTFKPNPLYRTKEIKEFNRQFTKFIQRMEYQLGYKPVYIAIPEKNNSEHTNKKIKDTYHMHAIFFNIPYLHSSKWEEIYNLGFVTPLAVSVQKPYLAMSYVLKYIGKESTLNSRVLMPRNIQRPEIFNNCGQPNYTLIKETDTIIYGTERKIKTCLYKKQ